jgi:hypothetical protein
VGGVCVLGGGVCVVLGVGGVCTVGRSSKMTS